MRLRVLSLVIVCVMFNRGICQDTLQIIGSNPIGVRVLEVSPGLVKFKLLEEPEGTVYTVVKSAVSFIHYGNGTREDLIPLDTMAYVSDATMVDWAELGSQQADSNYYGDEIAAVLVGSSTVLLTPLLGWIPALLFSTFPPSEVNLNILDYKLRHNKVYYEAYRHRAYQIKRKLLWDTYGTVAAIMSLRGGLK